jgi:hypothetical protein
VFLIVLSFQACQKDYTLSVVEMPLPEKCKMGSCKTGEINPEIDQHRPPTKVLFVVDNSLTMSLSQEYLGKGVDSLTKDLRGFDTDFFIYSTSDKHVVYNGREKDDKAVLNKTPVRSCSWAVQEGQSQISNSGAGVCTNNIAANYIQEEKYLMDSDIAVSKNKVLKLKSEFNDDQFNQLNQDLSEVIRSVGTDGDSNETGICTLVRSVYNDSGTSIFKRGDNAAMVVLSDENDFSGVSSCLSRSTTEFGLSGQSAVEVACAKNSSCYQEKYKLVYQPQMMSQNYKNYRLAYQCNTSEACNPGQSCSNVRYVYSLKRPQLNYSLLRSVDYTMNLAAILAPGKKIKMNCYKDRPYTFNFNSYVTKYSRSLNFKCEEWRDGLVDVGAGLLSQSQSISDYNGQNCSTTCDDALKVLANVSCGSFGNTFSPVRDLRLNNELASCSVSCSPKVYYTPLPSPFVDTAITAATVDLRSTSFILSGLSYANLWEYASLKAYPSVANIVRRDTLTTVNKTVDYSGKATCAAPATLCNCTTSDQSDTASNYCNTNASGSFLNANSCQIDISNITLTAASTVYYSDRVNNADTRDLRTSSFRDPPNDSGTLYLSLGDWLTAKYPGRTLSGSISIGTLFSSGVLNPSSSQLPTSISQFSCETLTSGVSPATNCSGADYEWVVNNVSGGSTVLDCKRSCIASSNITFNLSNSNDDRANFCTNTSSGTSFVQTSAPMGTFINIGAYAQARAVLGANNLAYLNSCTRSADARIVLDPAIRNTSPNSSVGSCPNPFPAANTLFSTTTLCSGGSIVVGTGSLSCTNSSSNVSDTSKPILTATPTPMIIQNPPPNMDICNGSVPIAELAYNGVTYSNLRQYYNALYPNRAADSIAPVCSFVSGTKQVVPPALVSSATVRKDWTFPADVLAKSQENNSNYLTQSFIAQSRYLFGDTGFFVSAIVRDGGPLDQQAQCNNIGGDQGAGVKYMSLVTSVGSGVANAVSGEVSSICSADYSVALSGVSRWIKETVHNTYYFPNIDDEALILKVWLEKPTTGESKELIEDTDYEVVGSKLTFINPAIEPKGWLIKYIEWHPK